ncbi:MAG: hypothetical protein GX552_07880 [Chloroflexi bacterium]|jgi:hypothetical protein|nr:hypothetical protein [Chloroflexota bacterium]
MNLSEWLIAHVPAIRRAVDQRVQLALKAVDDDHWRPITNQTPTARTWADIRDQLGKIQEVCRVNPLASRLVDMTTDFVIGAQVRVDGDPWVRQFWEHPQNRLAQRLHQWCAELSRSGELFLVLSRNPVDRMSYVREVPAMLIDRIETDADDLERELTYHQLTDDTEGRWWPARDSDAEQVMLHYTVNKPVGETRGYSDLAQILQWLERYDLWLEDRVRINRYKGAYLWQVRINNALPGQLEAKRAQYSRVPTSGSIIVTDGSEEWTAVHPQISADDVEADGKAIRLMIAAGAGVPLHFLAEGESATRATAREMGTATYRHFAHRQQMFRWMLEDLVQTAARRAGRPGVEFSIAFESVLAEDYRGNPAPLPAQEDQAYAEHR